jgi:hypothetical protein
MRRAARLLATVVLLVGPTVLAFFQGGYFDGPRAAAGTLAWALVLVVAMTGGVPVPLGGAGRVAVAGLVALTAWSAVSLTWAPLIGPVVENVQRLLLYLGALLAAVALLRDPRAARAAEPVLALGALVVIGYGLAGRLLPGVVDLLSLRSVRAGGRLEQPLTYWNAEGLLAAMGLVLCVRLAGDTMRPTAIRVAASAACAPLGMGVYLSYSRGALAAVAIGLIVLLAFIPEWPQVRATISAVVSGVVVSACAAALPWVASLEGKAADHQREGAIMLMLLAVVMLATATCAARLALSERRGAIRVGSLDYAARWLPRVAAAAALLCVAGLVAGGLGEKADSAATARAAPSRLASTASVRYEYWRVGAEAFADHPVRGLGSGGFQVAWRMKRHVDQATKEIHSLPLEIAAELGVPGLLFLGMFLGGIAHAGRSALRLRAPLAAGAGAACTVWLLHATIDWDWQMPAVTLPAIVLAGGLIAAAEPSTAPSPEPEGVDLGLERPARELVDAK